MTVELKEWRSFSPAEGLSDAGIKRKSSSLNVVLTEQVGRNDSKQEVSCVQERI